MKENKTINLMKKVTGVVSGVGIAAIIGNAVKHVSPTNGAGFIMKACVMLGTGVLGGICCDAGKTYIDQKLDKAAELADEILKETPEEVIEAETVEVQ